MTELDLVAEWAKAFGLTLCIEALIATQWLARTEPSVVRRLVLVTVAQLATHPMVWFVWPAFHFPRSIYMVIAEGWAVAIEGVVYVTVWPSLRWRAFVISFVANMTSVAVGLLLRALHAS